MALTNYAPSIPSPSGSRPQTVGGELRPRLCIIKLVIDQTISDSGHVKGASYTTFVEKYLPMT